MHILRECPVVREAWGMLFSRFRSPSVPGANFFMADRLDWLFQNLSLGDQSCKDWSSTFGVALDWFWRDRNEVVFSQKANYAGALMVAIERVVADIIDVLRENRLTRIRKDLASGESPISRTPHSLGELKLNCDGAVSGSSGRAGCGGVVRDHWGAFQVGYSYNLGFCSIVLAELWSILHDLNLVFNRGFRRVLVESDSRMDI